MIQNRTDSWLAGHLALTLLAVDPSGLKGLHLRARAGYVRDAFLSGMPTALGTPARIPPTIDDTQLFGAGSDSPKLPTTC